MQQKSSRLIKVMDLFWAFYGAPIRVRLGPLLLGSCDQQFSIGENQTVYTYGEIFTKPMFRNRYKWFTIKASCGCFRHNILCLNLWFAKSAVPPRSARLRALGKLRGTSRLSQALFSAYTEYTTKNAHFLTPAICLVHSVVGEWVQKNISECLGPIVVGDWRGVGSLIPLLT